MKRDRTQIEKGMRLVGGACEVEQFQLLPRDRIEKGAFLHGGPRPAPRYGDMTDLSDIRKRLDALGERIAEAARRVRS